MDRLLDLKRERQPSPVAIIFNIGIPVGLLKRRNIISHVFGEFRMASGAMAYVELRGGKIKCDGGSAGTVECHVPKLLHLHGDDVLHSCHCIPLGLEN